MADEITPTTVIQNPRPIDAPEPPKPGFMSGDTPPPSTKSETQIEALLRRVAALERAVNGKVSK